MHQFLHIVTQTYTCGELVSLHCLQGDDLIGLCEIRGIGVVVRHVGNVRWSADSTWHQESVRRSRRAEALESHHALGSAWISNSGILDGVAYTKIEPHGKVGPVAASQVERVWCTS